VVVGKKAQWHLFLSVQPIVGKKTTKESKEHTEEKKGKPR
jgi:hypothetical protein